MNLQADGVTSKSSASSGAPAPMEASVSTSSRVAAISGYTSSFRDIKRKFQALDTATLTDQEYESTLSNAPTPAPFQASHNAEAPAEGRGNDESSAVKPNTGVFDALVRAIAGRRGASDEERMRAATAVCNLCCDSAQNREIALQAGAVPALIMLLEGSYGPYRGRIQQVASAALSNLSGDAECKQAIALSKAPELLQRVLCGDNIPAASQAAGALWTLCIDSTEEAKSSYATTACVRTLVSLLTDETAQNAHLTPGQKSALRARASGCLSECCIRNPSVKSKIGSSGAIDELIAICKGGDVTCQRLAACALCNLVANHQGNKRLAKKCGIIREMADILKTSGVKEIECACASVIFNIANKSDKEELEALEVLPLLRGIKNSRSIDVRLMCVTNSVGETQSNAFGTY